jgi:hypothetical protein
MEIKEERFYQYWSSLSYQNYKRPPVGIRTQRNNSLCLAGYATLTLQPLDVSFYKALQCCYIEETVKWLRANPGHSVTQSVTAPFRKALCKATAIGNAVASFVHAGMWPLLRNVT